MQVTDSKSCQGSGNAGIPQASDSSTHFFSPVPSSLCLGQKCYTRWELSYTAYEKVLSVARLLETWAKNEKPIVIALEALGPTESSIQGKGISCSEKKCYQFGNCLSGKGRWLWLGDLFVSFLGAYCLSPCSYRIASWLSLGLHQPLETPCVLS